jgi:hypothetical protein
VAGSVTMIVGAIAISLAVAPTAEQASWRAAMARECERYGLDFRRLTASQAGEDVLAQEVPVRRWWDGLIIAAALGIFVWLAIGTERPPIALDPAWTLTLIVAMLGMLITCGWLLWKRTRFS